MGGCVVSLGLELPARWRLEIEESELELCQLCEWGFRALGLVGTASRLLSDPTFGHRSMQAHTMLYVHAACKHIATHVCANVPN